MKGIRPFLSIDPCALYLTLRKCDPRHLETFVEPLLLEADGKYPDIRHPKSRGMRRTWKYAAMTRDEDNIVDGGFPTAS